MPDAQMPANAIVSGAPNAPDLKGALLRHPVASGAVLVADDVILPSAPGFLAATLKPEMRAVSVAVDDVSGNAGLIQPGDYVDLLLTQQMDRRTDSPDLAVSSETVVEHVRVLAVGSEIKRPKNNGDAPEAVSPRPHRDARSDAAHGRSRRGRGAARQPVARAAQLRDGHARSGRVAPRRAPRRSERAPIWAGDISRAVRDLPRSRTARAEHEQRRAARAAHRDHLSRLRKSRRVGRRAGGRCAAEAAPPLPTVPAQR